jgi:hypothetical protein
MTLVLSVTTVGLPASWPLGDWLAGVAGRNIGCRCSLRKVLSGTCCCAQGGGACCATRSADPKPAEKKLPPCCAARLAAETAAKETSPSAARSCCQDQESCPPSDEPASDATVRGASVACGCGDDPADQWVVLSDPRLPVVCVRFEGERPTGSRWTVTSDRGEFQRPAPDAPPPKPPSRA